MRGGISFRIEESVEGDVVRLAPVGELDFATRNVFRQRLSQLNSRNAQVRLDLSRLEFIDASGLEVVISAIHHARTRASRLQIERELAPPVSRLLAIVGLELS